MNTDQIAERVAGSFLTSDNDRLVTATEMEQHCPDCARQIRAGELSMTHGELNEMLVNVGL